MILYTSTNLDPIEVFQENSFAYKQSKGLTGCIHDEYYCESIKSPLDINIQLPLGMTNVTNISWHRLDLPTQAGSYLPANATNCPTCRITYLGFTSNLNCASFPYDSFTDTEIHCFYLSFKGEINGIEVVSVTEPYCWTGESYAYHTIINNDYTYFSLFDNFGNNLGCFNLFNTQQEVQGSYKYPSCCELNIRHSRFNPLNSWVFIPVNEYCYNFTDENCGGAIGANICPTVPSVVDCTSHEADFEILCKCTYVEICAPYTNTDCLGFDYRATATDPRVYCNKQKLNAILKEVAPLQEVKIVGSNCQVGKTTFTRRFNLKGLSPLPMWKMLEVANILSRGEIFIDGEKYYTTGNENFTKVEYNNMYMINAELQLCPCSKSHYC